MENTLFEVRQSLYNYFKQKSTLNPSEDFSLVDFECKDNDVKIAMISAALESLEKADIVKSSMIGKTKRIWVLERPLTMIEQTVVLSFETANLIASIVNGFCKQSNDAKNYVDCLNIRDADIQKVLALLEIMSKKS